MTVALSTSRLRLRSPEMLQLIRRFCSGALTHSDRLFFKANATYDAFLYGLGFLGSSESGFSSRKTEIIDGLVPSSMKNLPGSP